MPDANAVVSRFRAHGSKSFGNCVYQVEMEAQEPFPLFGAKYNFNLVEVVNCPEFLVHFPTLERCVNHVDVDVGWNMHPPSWRLTGE